MIVGCMSHVEINGRVQDLAESEKQNKVVPGCGDGQQQDQGADTIVREPAESQPQAPASRPRTPGPQRIRGAIK